MPVLFRIYGDHVDYLGNPSLPVLFTDNRDRLLEKLHADFPGSTFDETGSIEALKHFFMLHKMNLTFYGGCSTIVPLPLHIFQKMVEDSRKAGYIPQPHHVRHFFEYSNEIAASCDNETVWYDRMKARALNWLG